MPAPYAVQNRRRALADWMRGTGMARVLKHASDEHERPAPSRVPMALDVIAARLADEVQEPTWDQATLRRDLNWLTGDGQLVRWDGYAREMHHRARWIHPKCVELADRNKKRAEIRREVHRLDQVFRSKRHVGSPDLPSVTTAVDPEQYGHVIGDLLVRVEGDDHGGITPLWTTPELAPHVAELVERRRSVIARRKALADSLGLIRTPEIEGWIESHNPHALCPIKLEELEVLAAILTPAESASHAINPAMSEPIMIRCEGSGCPVNPGGTCTMCGKAVGVLPDQTTTPEHQRDDIIARINRGDFG